MMTGITQSNGSSVHIWLTVLRETRRVEFTSGRYCLSSKALIWLILPVLNANISYCCWVPTTENLPWSSRRITLAVLFEVPSKFVIHCPLEKTPCFIKNKRKCFRNLSEKFNLLFVLERGDIWTNGMGEHYNTDFFTCYIKASTS